MRISSLPAFREDVLRMGLRNYILLVALLNFALSTPVFRRNAGDELPSELNELVEDKEPPSLDCFFSLEPLKPWYRTCNVTEVHRSCYQIDCPDGYDNCKAEDGTLYKLGSQVKWNETRRGRLYTCKCVRPGAVIWFVPPLPLDAPEYSPMKDCQLEGCEDRSGEFVEPYEERTYDNGTSFCRCVPGQDPNLMDAPTLYYFKCWNVQPLPVTEASQDTSAETEESDDLDSTTETEEQPTPSIEVNTVIPTELPPGPDTVG